MQEVKPTPCTTIAILLGNPAPDHNQGKPGFSHVKFPLRKSMLFIIKTPGRKQEDEA